VRASRETSVGLIVSTSRIISLVVTDKEESYIPRQEVKQFVKSYKQDREPPQQIQ